MAGKGKLTDEDRELWNRVRRSVEPLNADKVSPDVCGSPKTAGGEREPGAAHEPPPPAPPGNGETLARPTAPPYFPPVSRRQTGAPSLSALEPREKRRLSRGKIEVDDRLDLHGMRQSTAFHTLAGFLRRAQARRLKMVLVITGKGGSGEPGPGESTPGVLRRQVPQWLARHEFRDIVVGFEPASRRHGGDGALYVRIRRQKQNTV